MHAIYDISNPLHAATLAYPGDPAFSIERVKQIGPGSLYNLTKFSMGSHCGTHVDAPAHFIGGGETIDAFPPERWVSDALVVGVTGEEITAGDIPSGIAPGMSVLFKTRNSAALREGVFPDSPCLISTDAAERIAALKLNIAGIDWLTVESGEGNRFPVHQTLLGNGVLILESVLLDRVPPGRYTLHAAPLSVEGAEGAPCRALLVQPR